MAVGFRFEVALALFYNTPPFLVAGIIHVHKSSLADLKSLSKIGPHSSW